MAILDKRAEFAEDTALNTGGAASYLVGNVYNLEDVGLDQGVGGNGPFLVIKTGSVAVDSAADNTVVQFHLASDAQAAIAVDGSATYHFSTKAFAQSELTADKILACVRLPMGAYEQYLGILQTTSVAAVTAGKFEAYLTMNPPKWYALPDSL
jgi:hypothetical protein